MPILRAPTFGATAILNGVRRYTNLMGARGLTCSQLEQATGWEDALRDPHMACGEGIPDQRRYGTEKPAESVIWNPDCV